MIARHTWSEGACVWCAVREHGPLAAASCTGRKRKAAHEVRRERKREWLERDQPLRVSVADRYRALRAR